MTAFKLKMVDTVCNGMSVAFILQAIGSDTNPVAFRLCWVNIEVMLGLGQIYANDFWNIPNYINEA